MISKFRRPEQLYIFYQLESPYFHQDLNLKPYNGHINSTMTYRLDSDFVELYGSIQEVKQSSLDQNMAQSLVQNSDKNTDLQHEMDLNFENYSTNELLANLDQKRGILGLVSNCRSVARNQLIKDLGQKLVEFKNSDLLEIYGKCAGQLRVARPKNPLLDSKVNRKNSGKSHPARKFKFYLSLENSNCQDYVTEKLYNNALLQGAVPIVFGQSRQVYEKLLPKSAFIHVQDFGNFSDLAKQLIYLSQDKNQDEYLKFHEWRYGPVDSKIIGSDLKSTQNISFCRLCQKLHDSKYLARSKTYADLDTWWYGTENYKTCEYN